MKNNKLLSTFILFTIFGLIISGAMASEVKPSQEDLFYEELLQKHELEGQLSTSDSQKQKYNYLKGKHWQSNFKKQVRGVAAKLSNTRNIIKLNNPVIEISVK